MAGTGSEASNFEECIFPASDGLMLYARDYPPAALSPEGSLPVICLPGLTRNSRDFHQLATLLSSDPAHPRRVIAIDYRGRGKSGRDADKSHYNLSVEAEDVLLICQMLGVERAAFIGTSRGGLILHLIAMMDPCPLAAIILNDIGPEIEHEGLEQIQAYLNRKVTISDWEAAADELRAIHGRDFPALADSDWDDMARAIYREGGMGLIADFDPAIAEGIQLPEPETPLPSLWPQFEALQTISLMTIRGENSKLLSERILGEMQKRRPDMTILRATGQGHAPILHHPEIAEPIKAFLAKADPVSAA